MATVQIADIYDPLTFSQLTQEVSTAKNAFIQSGVLVDDPRITEQAAAGGTLGEMPNFKPLTQNEPNYSSDDPAVNSTPDNITKQKQIWRVAAMNRSWSAMDLARELSLEDPVIAINNSIGTYWAIEDQKRLVQSANGVLADNIANDSGDMVYDISTDANSAVTDAERISATAVLMAAATLGDKQLEFTAIAMHSICFTRLRIQNLIDYIPDSISQVPYPYYLGMRVVVDDGLPAIAGTYRIKYTTVLFKAGVFARGTGRVEQPSELERKPSTGNGGGQTIIYSRKAEVVHPWGCSFLSASVAGHSATLAELATAGNWDRIYNRKNIGIAFLKTNG